MNNIEEPSEDTIQYAKYILNHYDEDAMVDIVALARDLEDRGLFKGIKSYQNIKTCENCRRRVDIDTYLLVDSTTSIPKGSKHNDYCDYVYGRRGWRQLGAYDG